MMFWADTGEFVTIDFMKLVVILVIPAKRKYPTLVDKWKAEWSSTVLYSQIEDFVKRQSSHIKGVRK